MATGPPVCLVVAASQQLGIGLAGQLPWRLPGDMAAFKRITTTTAATAARSGTTNAVVMGRKTWDSIPAKFRPLPGRTNVVLTRNPAATPMPAGVRLAPSLEDALASLRADAAIATVYIIGGGQIYQQALEAGVVDRIYLTRVLASPVCDTFLPALDSFGFVAVYESLPQADPASGLGYQFSVLDGANAHPALPFGADLEALLFAQMIA